MTILRRFTDFVLQNRWQAIGAAFVIAYIPLLGSISILIAGLVTLRKGAFEGGLILIAATVPYILRYYAGHPSDAEFEFFALNIIVLSNILVWLFAIVLRRFDNWGLIFEYGFLIGIVVIGLIHILVPEVKDWWATELTQFFNKSNLLAKMSSDEIVRNREVQAKVITAVKFYATGFIVISILMNAILQLAISRWWQAVIFNPGGLSKELHGIRLGHVVAIVFIICMVLAVFKNETAIDVLPVAYVTFAVAGLSLLHYYFKNIKTGWFWLFLIYIGFVLLFPVSLIILSIIAFLDSWVDVRKRLVKL